MLWSLGWALLAQDARAGSKDFDVSFEDCTEFAGIGFVPYSNASALVPASYSLAGDGTNAIIVVRVVQCEAVSVDGKKPRATTLSQVGITVVGPDASADIDNYTLWYATDNSQLHAKLQAAGVDSVNDQHLSYSFVPDGLGGGALDIDVDPPQGASFVVSGTAIVPAAAPTPFVARWWKDGSHGTVSMLTDLPDIVFSSATTELATPLGGDLADLIGAETLLFPILDSYNAFATAYMEVRVD